MGKFGIESIRGVVPPIATPINEDESVDEKGMRRLVNFLIEGGAHGLFVMGGTGEFFCFPDREKGRAIEIVVEEAGSRVPVIAGVTDLSTCRAIENAQVAQEKGADFITSMPPFFFSLAQDSIYEFYSALADDTDVPLLLYNILNPIHTNIQPETVKKLAEHPHIIGMKDSDDFAHVQEVVFETEDSNFRVLTGLESHFVASIHVGAAGGVLSAANFCPRLCVDVFEKASSGDYGQALELQRKLNRLLAELKAGGFSSWWGVVKTALSILDIGSGAVTRPVPTCTDEERAKLKRIMAKYELM